MDENLADSASAPPTTSQEHVIAFVQEILRQRAGQSNALPTPSLMDPSPPVSARRLSVATDNFTERSQNVVERLNQDRRSGDSTQAQRTFVMRCYKPVDEYQGFINLLRQGGTQ
ncbi:hypothetical protein ACHAPX_004878 [Trichoderma viride]